MGTQVAQADRYPWGPRMQLSTGNCWYHCFWQLGTWHWFHEHMDPHTVSFGTGIGMYAHCAEWQYSDLLCGADWTSYVIKTKFLHLHGVTLRGGMTYLFFHPCFAWAYMGELQWSRHDSSKVSLSPCCSCLLELSLSYQAKGPINDFGTNHNQDHLWIGHGWYDQQQHILIITLDSWDLEVVFHKPKVGDGGAPCPL